MIDERTMERAANALEQAARGRWPRPYMEAQDEGTLLFMRVEADVPREVFNDALRREVALLLNPIVPRSPSQTVGSWIVVFTKRGEVYESLLPNAL